MRRLAILMLLTGCASEVPLPPPGTARIEMSTGGAFFGQTQTIIYADGTTVAAYDFPGEAPERHVRKASPDAYRAAAAVLAEQGLRAKAAQVPGLACVDFGADMILADPPIAGFDMISAGCPDDPVVTALKAAVLAALVPPYEP